MLDSNCTLPIHPFLKHPRTGAPLQALGFTRRGPIWPVMGGSGEGEGGEGSQGDGASGAGDGSTYAPPATQADLDRIIQDRLTRATSKFKDYDDLKTKAQQHDALLAEMGTDQEKAVAKAREDAAREVAEKATPRVVRAEFKAAAQGVLDKDQLDALLEDLDLTKYVDKDGEPDTDRIEKKVAALAPKEDPKNKPRPINLGQGNRQQAGARPGDQGRAMAEKRGFVKA